MESNPVRSPSQCPLLQFLSLGFCFEFLLWISIMMDHTINKPFLHNDFGQGVSHTNWKQTRTHGQLKVIKWARVSQPHWWTVKHLIAISLPCITSWNLRLTQVLPRTRTCCETHVIQPHSRATEAEFILFVQITQESCPQPATWYFRYIKSKHQEWVQYLLGGRITEMKGLWWAAIGVYGSFFPRNMTVNHCTFPSSSSSL